MLRLWFTYCIHVAELQGLSLSGGDEKKAQDRLKEGVKSQYPQLTGILFVGSDTHGALATALPSGRLRVLFFYAAHIFQCFHTVLMGSNQDSRPMDSPYKNDVYPQSTHTHACRYTHTHACMHARTHARKQTNPPTHQFHLSTLSLFHSLFGVKTVLLSWSSLKRGMFWACFWRKRDTGRIPYGLGEVIPDVMTDKVCLPKLATVVSCAFKAVSDKEQIEWQGL